MTHHYHLLAWEELHSSGRSVFWNSLLTVPLTPGDVCVGFGDGAEFECQFSY